MPDFLPFIYFLTDTKTEKHSSTFSLFRVRIFQPWHRFAVSVCFVACFPWHLCLHPLCPFNVLITMQLSYSCVWEFLIKLCHRGNIYICVQNCYRAV